MGTINLPVELKPTDEDYEYFLTTYDLDVDDVDYYYRQTWKDFIDFTVKEDFSDYISEMRDEWQEEKETDGYDGVPPFKEWHETIHEFKPILEEYIKKNKDAIYNQFKEYIKEITSPHDYFELEKEEPLDE